MPSTEAHVRVGARATILGTQPHGRMRRVSDYAVVTFSSTHQAMAGEDALHAQGVDFEVVPTPKEVSAGCGLALRVRAEELPRTLAALEVAEVSHGQVVRVERD